MKTSPFSHLSAWHRSGSTSQSSGPRTTTGPGVIVGADRVALQGGTLGQWQGRSVRMDLSGCHTISLFGVQGFGKSYSMGAIVEMATAALPGINTLPHPLATLAFHYHRSDAYAPELLACRYPNDAPLEVARLGLAGLRPYGLPDVVLLVPAAKVDARRLENPGVEVQPIAFAPSELGAEGWRLLMCAAGNDALYMRQLVSVLRRHRDRLDLEVLRRELDAVDLAPGARRLVDDRLALAAEYLSPDRPLSTLFRPGRLVIVDLRDEWIGKDEALVPFIVLMGRSPACWVRCVFSSTSGVDAERTNRPVWPPEVVLAAVLFGAISDAPGRQHWQPAGQVTLDIGAERAAASLLGKCAPDRARHRRPRFASPAPRNVRRPWPGLCRRYERLGSIADDCDRARRRAASRQAGEGPFRKRNLTREFEHLCDWCRRSYRTIFCFDAARLVPNPVLYSLPTASLARFT